MLSGISSYFFGPTALPTIPTVIKSADEWKKIEQEISDCSYSITEKQFAHRLTPTYLDNTSIEGIHSIYSTKHWIEILSLWIEGKGLFYPLSVSKAHLEQLRDILKSYAKMLEYPRSNDPDVA